MEMQRYGDAEIRICRDTDSFDVLDRVTDIKTDFNLMHYQPLKENAEFSFSVTLSNTSKESVPLKHYFRKNIILFSLSFTV